MEKITRKNAHNEKKDNITNENLENIENTQPVQLVQEGEPEEIEEVTAAEESEPADTEADAEVEAESVQEEETVPSAEVEVKETPKVRAKSSSRGRRHKKEPKHKVNVSKLITSIIAVAIIVLLSFGCYKGFTALGRLITSSRPVETHSEEISITSTGTLAYDRFQRGVLVANSGNISYFKSDLNCQWEMPGFDGQPVIHTNGKYALVAYTNTPNARLINGADAVAVTGSGKIVSSYVNKNGYFALVMTEDGYKNQISVFDNNGKLIYKWHSAENFITSVALSPDNKNLAAATIGFTENGFDSGIMMFDLAQNQPNAGQHQSDNLIMNIEFVSNNKLVAIGDKNTVYYKKNGKLVDTIDYSGKKLITFDIADNGRVILAFAKDDSAMSNCDIYSYKTNGREGGHYETEGRVLSVSCCDENVLVAKDSEFELLTDRCRRINSVSVVRDLKKSVLFNKGRDAFVISGNVAQVIGVR